MKGLSLSEPSSAGSRRVLSGDPGEPDDIPRPASPASRVGLSPLTPIVICSSKTHMPCRAGASAAFSDGSRCRPVLPCDPGEPEGIPRPASPASRVGLSPLRPIVICSSKTHMPCQAGASAPASTTPSELFIEESFPHEVRTRRLGFARWSW